MLSATLTALGAKTCLATSALAVLVLFEVAVTATSLTGAVRVNAPRTSASLVETATATASDPATPTLEESPTPEVARALVSEPEGANASTVTVGADRVAPLPA